MIFHAEPDQAGRHFRSLSAGNRSSPKVLADAWLLAFARASNETLITFDRALVSRGAACLL
ncbi:MAG: hypothetical protein ABUS49_04875 [Acidobacteriota bacterium]